MFCRFILKILSLGVGATGLVTVYVNGWTSESWTLVLTWIITLVTWVYTVLGFPRAVYEMRSLTADYGRLSHRITETISVDRDYITAAEIDRFRIAIGEEFRKLDGDYVDSMKFYYRRLRPFRDRGELLEDPGESPGCIP